MYALYGILILPPNCQSQLGMKCCSFLAGKICTQLTDVFKTLKRERAETFFVALRTEDADGDCAQLERANTCHALKHVYC